MYEKNYWLNYHANRLQAATTEAEKFFLARAIEQEENLLQCYHKIALCQEKI